MAITQVKIPADGYCMVGKCPVTGDTCEIRVNGGETYSVGDRAPTDSCNYCDGERTGRDIVYAVEDGRYERDGI